MLAGSVMAAAVAVGVGGIAWQVFFQIGGLVSSQQALGVVG
ncbi:hypothetical protein [Cryobacterium tepidiphilum]|nr:hypothetical protein [Cryobacterium tepidiphilum]